MKPTHINIFQPTFCSVVRLDQVVKGQGDQGGRVLDRNRYEKNGTDGCAFSA